MLLLIVVSAAMWTIFPYDGPNHLELWLNDASDLPDGQSAEQVGGGRSSSLAVSDVRPCAARASR